MTTTGNHAVSAEVAARVERRWAIASMAIVFALILIAAYAGIHQAIMPQAYVETADPATLHLSGEFIESNLGSAVQADGSVLVRAIGQQYSFTPQCVVVPAQTKITIRATSADVLHGMFIQGTNVNSMLVPGYISMVETKFAAPGEHVVPCHEFCGYGHQGMWGKIRVIDKAAFAALASGKRRLTCADE